MKRARECVCQQLDFHGKEDPDEYELPGFRFHPTEQELVEFYLKNAVQGKRMKFNVIRTLDLYRYDPWELPRFGPPGEGELFFFVPRDKNGSGRTNRIAVSGYWKSTGSDRPILDGRLRYIGLRKTLVFYEGRAPHGQKTEWVMKEYRVPDHHKPKVEVVVCRVHRKTTPRKWIEQQTWNPLEDLPSPDDDRDLDSSNKPQETSECEIELQIAPNLCQYGAEAEGNCVAQAEVSCSGTESEWDVYGRLIDPAFEPVGDYGKCEGFSVCSNDRNLRFMDLLDSSSDCSCFDPEFPGSFIDGETSGLKKELQTAPDLSLSYFCSDVALYSHVNLEENYPSRDVLVTTPESFDPWNGAASTPEYSFLDADQEAFSTALPL